MVFGILSMSAAGALGHAMLQHIAEMSLGQATAAMAVGSTIMAAAYLLLYCCCAACGMCIKECGDSLLTLWGRDKQTEATAPAAEVTSKRATI